MMKEKRRIIKMVIIGVLTIFVMAGCASIVSKSQWPINIVSSPDQANVSISERDQGKIHEGKTPMMVTLSSKGGYFRSRVYTVTVSKEGFSDKTVVISGNLNPWYVGNLVFGGLIGLLIVDPLTGAMWTLEPDKVNLVFDQKSSNLENSPTMYVMLMEDVPSELRDKMTPIK